MIPIKILEQLPEVKAWCEAEGIELSDLCSWSIERDTHIMGIENNWITRIPSAAGTITLKIGETVFSKHFPRLWMPLADQKQDDQPAISEQPLILSPEDVRTYHYLPEPAKEQFRENVHKYMEQLGREYQVPEAAG